MRILESEGNAAAGKRPGASPGRRHRTFGLKRASTTRAGVIDRAEDILASILNLTAEGVIVADGDLRILVFSSGAEAIFGYAANEVLGRSVEILIPQEFRRQHRDHVDEFKSRKQTSSRMRGRMQTMGLTRSGELKPVEVDLSRLQAAQGEIITAIVRDVTERVETERLLSAAAEAANTANHAKSAFLAAMSHEIRTPLNGILGMAQAMAQDELPTRQRERLAVLRDSGASLLQILNDLLDLSKIESGKLTLEEAEFDIEELLRSACAAFASLAAQKGLAYELKVSEGARGRYRGDPLRLRQILHNLISNAIKFTEQGRVEVAVSRRGGRLVMVVRDTGIGIPRDRVSRIFDRFEQADVSTTRRFGGTGLGLAICHELVRLMGGTIQVRSEPGRGTVFRVEAPTPRVSSAASSDGKRADAAPGRRALRILVAEDNPTNQIVIRSLLEAAGLDCVVAPDGAAALEAWQAGEWDVILMDVQMPVMDGPTATAAIRAIETEEGGGRIPILGVTANAMAHQIEEYIAAGMDGVIAKPIQLTELLTAIGELVD